LIIPDWISHLCFTYILSRVIRLDIKTRPIFLIGALLPDFERFMTLLSRYIGSQSAEQFFIRMLSQPFHSLLGIFLLSIFISTFFTKEKMRPTFLLLFVGGLTHILLDMLMWPWGGGYSLLFPLLGTNYKYGFGLIWPGNTTLPVILSITTIFLLIYNQIKTKKESRQNELNHR